MSGEIATKACPVCGASIQRSSRKRFCSVACFRQHRASLLEVRECSHCGKHFEPKEAGQKYCTPRCRRSADNERRVGGACLVCGSPTRRRNTKFCCKEHYFQYYREKAAAANKPCVVCGKPRKPEYSHTCSKECYAIFRTTTCLNCGKPCGRAKNRMYCSVACRREYEQKRGQVHRSCGKPKLTPEQVAAVLAQRERNVPIRRIRVEGVSFPQVTRILYPRGRPLPEVVHVPFPDKPKKVAPADRKKVSLPKLKFLGDI